MTFRFRALQVMLDKLRNGEISVYRTNLTGDTWTACIENPNGARVGKMQGYGTDVEEAIEALNAQCVRELELEEKANGAQANP